MSWLRRRARWVWVMLAVVLPLALYQVLAEQASWRPRTLRQGLEVSSIAFSADGTLLACGCLGGVGGVVKVWNPHTGKLVGTHLIYEVTRSDLENYEYDINDVSFVGGSHVLAGLTHYWVVIEGQGVLWRMDKKEAWREFYDENSNVLSSLAVSRSGRFFLAVGSTTGVNPVHTVLYFDSPSGRQRKVKGAKLTGDFALALSPDDHQVAVWDKSNPTLWQLDVPRSRLDQPRITKIASLPAPHVDVLTYSPDGRRLVTATSETLKQAADVCLWDAHTLRLQRRLTWPVGGAQSNIAVTFSHDGSLLACASEPPGSTAGEVRLFDAATGRLLRVINGHQRSIEDLAFAPDDQVLATGSSDRTVKLWRLR